MSSSSGRFVGAFLILSGLAITVAATVLPPDPYTLVLAVVPLVVAAALVSYLLVYRGGLEYLERRR
ncbi:DUF7534 family protein [Natrarchaeobius oligotrophus]|uniref:Integral membrane protein n=1 Tax=Natrarchaeobius chitinivorans TaxID=1679083 RepID=A0A3N6PTQ0_NATCH|nr:hypothetical protein [Natrarchaeobius chitinivorans]RQH03076.1 hypothetical protein EA472_00290 [Natrarchaeobius chitinivorans]